MLQNRTLEVEAVTAEQPRYGGTLIAAISGEAPTANPSLSSAVLAQITFDNVFNALAQVGPNGELVPDLAESWEVSKDGKSYTFHLVKNALWHDGKPFTSADVKYTFEQVLPKYHPKGAVVFQALDKVDTPDQYTAIVRMKYPDPAFLSYMNSAHGSILPKHLYEGTDILKNPYNVNPVGTGPFKLKEYVKGDHITFVRNDKYFKTDKPYLDRIVFRIVPDSVSRTMAFEKGEIDFLTHYGFPESELERLSKLPGVATSQVLEPKAIQVQLMMNVRKPPLNNVLVRQAMAYAIDKQEIFDKVFFGIGKVAIGVVSSKLGWPFNPNPTTKYEKNLAKANQLLDDAGYPRGADGMRFSVGHMYDMALYQHSKTAEVFRLQMREVGINIVLGPVDKATNNEKMSRGDFDIVSARMASGPDAAVGTGFLWSKNIRPVPEVNNGGYNNSYFDSLHEQALKETDRDKRKQLFFEMQEIAARDMPNIYLVESSPVMAFKSTFKGLPYGGYSVEPMEGIWWSGGSSVSAGTVESAIKAAEKEIENLKGQFYDVSAALKQIEQARKLLEAGDYVKAHELARGAVGLAQPPYALYGVVGLAIVAVVGVLLYRKKKSKPTV